MQATTTSPGELCKICTSPSSARRPPSSATFTESVPMSRAWVSSAHPPPAAERAHATTCG
eukprot:5081208-Pyramimonas_sp.AAC.1